MNNPLNKKFEKPKILIALTSETTLRAFYLELIPFLKERGWTVEVVVSQNQDLEELSLRLDIKIHHLDLARNPKPIQDFVAFIRMYKIIRSSMPQILLAATPKASLLAISASFFAGVENRIYQVWGLRYESMAGYSRKFFILIEKITAWFANKVTANSFSLAKQIKEDRIAREVTVIGSGSSHGVNTDYYSPNKRFPSADPEFSRFVLSNNHLPLVLFIGRITRDKGIGTLLKAQKIAIEKSTPFRLAIIGDTEDESVLLEIQHSFNPYLLKVDFVSDIRPYLKPADVLCLPSLREGFPNVVLEAAAMEVPSIVSNGTGVVDSVVDGVTGLIFPVGDFLKLQELINQLAINPDLSIELGKSARIHAVNRYSQKLFFPIFEGFLEEQLK